MESLLVGAVVFGVVCPLVHRYLAGEKQLTPTSLPVTYALGYLVANWALIQLGIAGPGASLNLTQHLILAGIVFAFSAATIMVLERFGKI